MFHRSDPSCFIAQIHQYTTIPFHHSSMLHTPMCSTHINLCFMFYVVMFHHISSLRYNTTQQYQSTIPQCCTRPVHTHLTTPSPLSRTRVGGRTCINSNVFDIFTFQQPRMPCFVRQNHLFHGNVLTRRDGRAFELSDCC